MRGVGTRTNPSSIVSEWPRPGIFLISEVAELDLAERGEFLQGTVLSRRLDDQ